MKKEIVFISGMSGAGKNIALQTLEDLGYYCLDNVPPKMFEGIINTLDSEELDRICFISDLRSFGFLDEFTNSISNLKNNYDYSFKTVFLDANDNVLIGRYKHSRRKHPIIKSTSPVISIEKERELLSDIKKISDIKIDTSLYDNKQLKDKFEKLFYITENDFKINIISFGFKYGVPLDCDLVFDIRFLKNPYYDLNLRHKTGLEKEVSDYIYNEKESNIFYDYLTNFLNYLIPKYIAEGKQQLVIGIGCTGGKHRSVSTVEKLVKEYSDSHSTYAIHRDIERE